MPDNPLHRPLDATLLAMQWLRINWPGILLVSCAVLALAASFGGQDKPWTTLALSIAVLTSLLVIGEHNQHRQTKTRRLQQSNLLRGIAETNYILLKNDPQNNRFNHALEILGRAMGIDRVYINQFHPDSSGAIRVSQRYEYCGPGVASTLAQASSQNCVPIPSFYQQFLQGKTVTHTHSTLPPETPNHQSLQDARSFLSMPIMVYGELWGSLGFTDCQRERVWSEEEIEVLKSIASSFGESIQRTLAESQLKESEARYKALLQQSDRQAERLALVLKVSQRIGQELEPRALYRLVVETISQAFGYELVSIHIRQGDELVLQHQKGYSRWIERLTLGQDNPGVIERALLLGQSILIKDAKSDPDFIYSLPDLCSEVAVPLKAQGQTIGVLSVESCQVFYTEQDLELLEAIAAQVNIALERAQIFAALKEQETFHRTLLDILPVNVMLFDQQQVRYANPEAVQTYGGGGESLVGQPLERFKTKDAPLDQDAYRRVLSGQEVPLTEDRSTNLNGEVVDIEVSMHPVVVGGETLGLITSRDIRERKRVEEALKASEARFKALVQNSLDVTLIVGAQGDILYASQNTPILRLAHKSPFDARNIYDYISGDEQAQAAFEHLLAHPEQTMSIELKAALEGGGMGWFEVWGQNLLHDPAVGGIVLNVRDVSERKAYQSTIEHLAYHDVLTGLPNRRMLREQSEQILSQARRAGSEAVLVYLDLDRFKEVNDTLGHEAGDELLVQVARRIQGCVRAGDILARLGGDEFALLLSHTSVEGAAQAASRIMAVLQQPFAIAGANLRIGASLGLGVFPRDGETLEDLMRVADVAMYRAKENQGGFVFYSPELDRYSRERLQLLQDMQEGLERGEFYLEYQPILDTASGQWSRVEALARWDHPTRGPISPATFIPLAEESNLIRELDKKMLSLTCLEAGILGLPVSVNISARTLYDPSFPQMVGAALSQGHLQPHDLYLEITETALIEDLPRAFQHLRALRELGVRIALDDFGVGNTSIAYLKDLPIDILKIDRSFVSGIGRNPREEAILFTILSLGTGLGLATVAEGVETPEQIQWLAQKGCQLLQGYAVARPQLKDKLLQSWKAVVNR